MSYEQLLNDLRKEGILNQDLSQHGRSASNLEKNKKLHEEVLKSTSFIEYDIDTKGRISTLQMGLTLQPKCNVCQSIVKIRTTGRLARTYPKFCPGCSNKDTSVKDKKKLSSLERYGTENISQAAEVKDKRKQTNLERRGVEYSLSDPKIREQIKLTCIEKFGGVAPIFSEEVKQTVRETCQRKYDAPSPLESNNIQSKIKDRNNEKYGVDYPFQAKEIHKKIKETNNEKYGVDYPLQNENILNTCLKKSKQIMLEKYGVQHALQNNLIRAKATETLKEKFGDVHHLSLPEIRQKIITTTRSRYNADYFQHQHISNETLDKLNDKMWLTTAHHSDNKTLWKIAEELDVATSTVSSWFIKHGIDVKTHVTSQDERDLAAWLASVYPTQKIITNTRQIITPKELDVYLPELQFAVEYNGVYFHSTEQISKQYHFDKTEQCALKGIELVHVFDKEWKREPLIIKGYLNKKLGLVVPNDSLQLEVKEIPKSVALEFYKNYGFDSFYSTTNFNIAVQYDNEIVFVCSYEEETNVIENYAEIDDVVFVNAPKIIQQYIETNFLTTPHLLHQYRLGDNIHWPNSKIIGQTPPKELYPNVWDCGYQLLELT